MTKKGVEMLKRHEGRVVRDGRHIPYTDSTGHTTIGYGRNLSSVGISQTEMRRIILDVVGHPYRAQKAKVDFVGEGDSSPSVVMSIDIKESGISDGVAVMMLENDIAVAHGAVENRSWFSALNDARRDVVVNMVFNLGLSGFSGFVKMIEAMREGDYFRAAEEMLDSKWARQVGFRASELAEIMRSGSYD